MIIITIILSTVKQVAIQVRLTRARVVSNQPMSNDNNNNNIEHGETGRYTGAADQGRVVSNQPMSNNNNKTP